MADTWFADQYRAERKRKIDECTQNRALVLRYPDIAKRLCEPPYSAGDPANWTGYIPGPLGAENSRGVVSMNNSPVRAQLLAILHDAAQAADNERRPT